MIGIDQITIGKQRIDQCVLIDALIGEMGDQLHQIVELIFTVLGLVGNGPPIVAHRKRSEKADDQFIISVFSFTHLHLKFYQKNDGFNQKHIIL